LKEDGVGLALVASRRRKQCDEEQDAEEVYWSAHIFTLIFPI
jgi:hypothetical protein